MSATAGGRKWPVYAGIAVSAALLAIVLYQVDRIDFAETLRRLGLLPFSIAVAGYVAAFAAVSCRFGRAVGRLTGEPVPLTTIGKIYFPIVLATNLLAHGVSIGAEIARLLFLKRMHRLDMQTAVTVLLVDRLVGISFVAIFALLSVIVVFWPASIEARLFATGGIVLGAGLLLFLAAIQPPLQRLTDRLQFLRRILGAYLAGPRLIAEQLLVSAAALCGLAVALFSISRSLGAGIPFGIALAATPIVYIGTSVPFTYAGWGSREITCIAVLAWTGWMSAADAVAVSVTLGIASFVASLPGLMSIRLR